MNLAMTNRANRKAARTRPLDVAYIWVSTEAQATGASLRAQRAALQTEATRPGLCSFNVC